MSFDYKVQLSFVLYSYFGVFRELRFFMTLYNFAEISVHLTAHNNLVDLLGISKNKKIKKGFDNCLFPE